MKHNVWDEQEMENPIQEFHGKQIAEMDLPAWLIDIPCPFCDHKLSWRSIRRLSLCLNARNIGDVAVEFSCDNCSTMDTLYYREGIKDIHDYADFLRDDSSPIPSPNVEEKMFKLQYNNLLERMISAQNTEGENDDNL